MLRKEITSSGRLILFDEAFPRAFFAAKINTPPPRILRINTNWVHAAFHHTQRAKLRRHIIEVRVWENSTADYRRDLVGVSIDKKIGAIIKF